MNKIKKEHEDFLIDRFKKDWLKIQRITNRDKQLERLRDLGLGTGKIILGLMAVGGILTVGAVAPGILVAFGGLNKQLRWFLKDEDYKKTLFTYRKNNYIKFSKDKNNCYKIELTERGKRLFLKSAAQKIRINKSEQQDGRWWLVTFDIPRKHNTARNLFRDKLKMLGMQRLQDSVFISKGGCLEEVNFWATLYNITDFIHVGKIEFLTQPKFS